MKYLGVLRLLFGWFALCGCAPSDAQALPVAVAANVQFAFTALATAFTTQTGIMIQASYASTGKLAAQIQHGAPFALFLAADTTTPLYLAQQGATLSAPIPYVEGALVIWSLDPTFPTQNWAAWLRQQTGKVALADPNLAPYGRAGLAALTHYHLRPQIDTRLVYGENVAQTAHFVASGAAQAGLVAKALVVAPILAQRGRWADIPIEAHTPLQQSLVLLKPAARYPAAQQLVDFLLHSPVAREIWQRYGYRPLN